MFSGIVEDLGTIAAVSPRGAGRTLVIETALPIDLHGEGTGGIKLGDSVAVNGACLTAEDLAPGRFTVAAGRETIERTIIGGLSVGARVHLERALLVSSRLDGHIVSGHVDGVGVVEQCRQDAESIVLWVSVSADLSRYIATKGSVAVDGVSLTVNEVAGSRFRLNLIPFSAEHTTLASRRPGDRVNIEVDLVARYVERLLGSGSGGLSREQLFAAGFGSSKER